MRYIGVDIIEIARVEEGITRWGEKFLRRLYTESECRLYRGKISSLAARFAGKEAVVKALGNRDGGISYREIEILADSTGRPVIQLYGNAERQAVDLGLDRFDISLSHSRGYAVAFVIGETK